MNTHLCIIGGQVTCTSINIEDDEPTPCDVSVQTSHITQALVGSEFLPTNIDNGVMTFTDTNDCLSNVNTCGPKINFTLLDDNRTYDQFERTMLNIMFGTYGFGQK